MAVEAKRREIRTELETWGREVLGLKLGERIEFSLRIKTYPITAPVNDKHPYDLAPNEFFTHKRLFKHELSPPMVTRIVNVFKNNEVRKNIMFPSIPYPTMSSLLTDFPSEVAMAKIVNIGKKTAEEVAKVIRASGLRIY